MYHITLTTFGPDCILSDRCFSYACVSNYSAPAVCPFNTTGVFANCSSHQPVIIVSGNSSLYCPSKPDNTGKCGFALGECGSGQRQKMPDFEYMPADEDKNR